MCEARDAIKAKRLSNPPTVPTEKSEEFVNRQNVDTTRGREGASDVSAREGMSEGEEGEEEGEMG